MAQFAQLTLQQRYQLETLRQLKMTQKNIAVQLGVSASTISRELHRNAISHEQTDYQPEQAQQRAHQRRQRTPYKLKAELEQQVRRRLRQRHSPEQISGQLELEAGQKRISHETIYRFVYRQTAQGEDFVQYLRIRHRKRYKKRGEASKRGQIPGRVGIEERPAVVETNTEIGHWEGDTIIGFDHDGVLLTLVERVTKWTLIVKLPTKKADQLAQAAIKALRHCPIPSKTLTLDNGKEFTDHATMSSELGIQVFFARPYHSWDRAGVPARLE